MDVSRTWGITLGELEEALRVADPSALFVPPRILRRVIKLDRAIPGAGLRVPHRKTYLIGREKLLTIVDRAELGLAPHAVLPETVILLARPDVEQLATMIRLRALAKYWRLLFHVRVHQALEVGEIAERLTLEAVARAIQCLGRTEFEEIRIVLRQEEMLLPPADDRSTLVEFIAVYLELRQFAPALVGDYFPTLQTNLAAVDVLLREWIDVDTLLESTRLEGAGSPTDSLPGDDSEAAFDRKAEQHAVDPRKQSERAYCARMERADRALARGNVVRSAMLRIDAARMIGPKLARTARNEARADIHRLAERLQSALSLSPEETQAWTEALSELLQPAIRFIWTPEARFLYDLQKVCIDHERGVYKLNVLPWALSWGRYPLRRHLPAQRDVLISKHLLGATRRLRAMRTSPRQRDTLTTLLHTAIERAQDRMRDKLRPRITSAFDEVGFRPNNLPETVARRKLTEELLDRVAMRGFLNFGDLRDAVSRNNLKIDDLSGTRELWQGDQLLQTDRRLSETLDGVYRGGEIYLRASQRISAVAFGTQKGRWLTQFVLLPFGGAAMLLAASQEVLEMFSGMMRRVPEVFRFWPVALLGCFLLCVMHSARFRHALLTGLRSLYRGLRWSVVELPRRLVQLPWVRQILESRAAELLGRYVLKPAVFMALIMAVRMAIWGRIGRFPGNLAIFVGLNLLLNSRLGRNVDEVVTDVVVRGWHRLRIRVLAAVFSAIVDTFHQLLEALERVLYTVDEWLRFRRGESRLATIGKAVLGAIWAGVAYIVRFCVTLLIEPQINPIKHFPVVTVSHKFILPLAFTPRITTVPSILGQGFVWLFGMSVESANFYALSIVWVIPGIFGFLAWELKENWRLYAANRSPELQRVIIGHHGEGMVRLLRPGFHSGTCPKLFQKLRRADRKAYATGQGKAVRRYRESIHETAEAVRHFVERDCVALLEQSTAWDLHGVEAGHVHVGVNNVRIELRCPALGTDSLWIAIEEHAGWLIAGVHRSGWLTKLTADQQRVLGESLRGVYKMCGIDLVREQIEGCFPPPAEYQIRESSLWVRPDPVRRDEFVYELRPNDRDLLMPTPLAMSVPALERRRLMFAAVPLWWTDWVAAWTGGTSPAAERPAVFTDRERQPAPTSG